MSVDRPFQCQNTFVIYGNTAQLLKFYRDMERATQPSDPRSTRLVVDLFLGAGYNIDQVQMFGAGVMRGEVQSIELEVEKGGYVVIKDTTDWIPNCREMQAMIDTYYPGLKMVYKAEEPRREVFINTDTIGTYLTERYAIDYWDCDSEEEVPETETLDGQVFPAIMERTIKRAASENEAITILANIMKLPELFVKEDELVREVCIEGIDWERWIMDRFQDRDNCPVDDLRVYRYANRLS